MSKIVIRIIVIDVVRDRLMHCADLFETFKVLIIDPYDITGTLKENNTIESVITKLRAEFEKDESKYKLIAIFHPYIAEGAWYDKKIKVVSTGIQWALFKDYLTNQCYNGEINL